MLALRDFRSRAKGLPDLLNWAAVIDDGVVQCKDGSLLAGYFYTGRDLQSSTDEERNEIAAHVNKAIAKLGGGWASWTDVARIESRSYPPPHISHFPDPVSRLVDEERRQGFEAEGAHFETVTAFMLQYTPPLRRKSRLVDLVYDDDPAEQSSPADRILAGFKKALGDFEDTIGNIARLERMHGYVVTDADGVDHLRDEVVNYCNYCLTGEAMELDIPCSGAYIDSYLAVEDLWPGEMPKLGEQYIACISIEGFPQESYPGILSVLDSQPMRYRWSSRMIYLDQHEALTMLNRYRRKWQQKIRGFWTQVFRTQGGFVNEDAALMTSDASAAIAEAESSLVGFGYYSSVVVLMDEDRTALAENARAIRREIRRCNFGARIETINSMEAWLGTMPAHPLPNVRRPPLHTENLSHLLPLGSVWTGRDENPCPYYPPGSPPLLYAATNGATPLRLNLHVDDVGHTLIFGPTGSGKTTMLATIAMQALRYKWVSIWGFDYKRGLLAAVKATGGQHYDVAGSDHPTFCPLAALENPADLAWAEEWIATCYEIQAGVPPRPEQRDAIHQAMVRLQNQTDEGARTLTHFVSEVQDADVRSALAYYTLQGPLGTMLDARADSIAFDAANFMVFEMEDLLAMKDQAVVPVLLYLFRRFEKSLRGKPSFLILDEAWMPLGHPVFREKLRGWLKLLRSKNCAVIMATQSLSDAFRSGLLDVLIESCPTKIFLPNAEAENGGSKDVPGPRDFYQAMGLNSQQISLIAHATAKRQYYLVQPEGRRLFELGLGPIGLAFAGASSQEDIAEINRLERFHGAQWPFVWLDQKGVDYAAFVTA